MANILTVKRRIQTALNVSKTTRAMQMIATSKLKRGQDQALSSRPYVEKLVFLAKNIADRLPEDVVTDYMRASKDAKKTLLLVFSPDKGLCGGLITSITKELLNEDKNTKAIFYLTVGKKIENTVAKLGKEIAASFEFGTTLPSFDMVYPLAKIVDDYFLEEKVSEVKILYSHFVSVFSQIPKVEAILPIKIPESVDKEGTVSFTLFEPSPSQILPALLRHYLEMTLYQYLLESYESEQAARMIAMKNATENAGDIIDYLKLEYNKQRQEKITNEILDIGGAAAALLYD
ncbi:ATP synthase F1 subunit gamma [Candidatus Roizmanbacteria bacterium RIFCSPHIGHO2_12_FULL_33_9]|uniref:ATP synthase gamma chain n=1 Tax=Candidatus Roizmanbacteria bacterium RIFCSPHIGHO2_12_FULL_33_9 TaxID=1802045 RepID=A0A1F7HJA3_9BACT|nr:MAG: ATP synthase F1 subunit gamma [Candidatus Roizmanbacteria bacterium RIFCSPHIGHO2_12_FULL_33_9]